MQNVKFQNPKGQYLAGVWHQVAGVPQTGNKNPTLIICHGFRGGKDGGGRAVELGEKIAGAGYNVLRFDFAGTGDSEGEFADVTLTGYMADLGAAVNFAKEMVAGPVVVLGRSFGGTTAICRAAVDGRIAGVCTWAAPADLAETFGKPLAEAMRQFDRSDTMTVTDEMGTFSLRRGFFDDFALNDVYLAGGAIAPRPLLILHGSADETVNVEQGKKIYAAAGQLKGIHILQEADHRFTQHFAEITNLTEKWLKKHFPPD